MNIELFKIELNSCPRLFENDYYFEFDSELNSKLIEIRKRKKNQMTYDNYCEYGVTEEQKKQAKDDEKYDIEFENYFNNKKDKIHIVDYLNSGNMKCRFCEDKINNINNVGYVYTNYYESMYVTCCKCEYLFKCECGKTHKNTKDKKFNITTHLKSKQHIKYLNEQN